MVGVTMEAAVTSGTWIWADRVVALIIGTSADGVFAGAHERSKSIEAISKRKSKRWGRMIMDALYITGLAHSRNTYETFRVAD